MDIKKKTRKKRKNDQSSLAMIVVLAVLIMAVCGILIGLRTGAKRREAIEADQKEQILQAEADEQAAKAAEEAEKAAEAQKKAEEEADKAREAEREDLERLLEEQAKEANAEEAAVIKDIAALGIYDVGAYAVESAVIPEEIELPSHVVCIDPTTRGDPDVNLMIGLKLKAHLEGRNYTVVMTRDSAGADPSPAQRAAAARDSGSEIVVSIRTSETDDPAMAGLTATGAADGTPELPLESAAQSRRLSQLVLDHACVSSGGGSRGIEITGALSGSSWTTIPWTFLNAGFISNPDEGNRLYQDDYQNRLAIGIANGIDAYFA